MNMSPTLISELARKGITYDIIPHRFTTLSQNTATSAHIPVEQMVKPVVLEDENGFVMALVPASMHVKIHELNQLLDRNMGLTTEDKLSDLFKDCAPGAIPPVGNAYHMDTVVDYALNDCEDLYIEAGNHTEVLHINGRDFRKLMKDSRTASISVH